VTTAAENKAVENNTATIILCMLTGVTTLKSGQPTKIYKRINKTNDSYSICHLLIAGVL